MSTSLAEQLQRLATPQTSALDRGKKRASLLFDPKEAAGLRKETVFEIGLDGLEELIAKNVTFEQFTNTLFSLTSKEFERSVQSSESNKKLDKHIRKFLLLLSPYFLLNCTYKVLEWLIYRYSIHEYNREDLLMLVLPYHESNIFVRVIQLLKIKNENDPWYFLKALQKPGVHLPKQTLLTHAANDPYFIKFVSQFIVEIVKTHEKPSFLTVAFNFYCSIFTGAIEYSKEVSEQIVTQMLPALMKGLSSDIPDFRAASYVITARLVTKCTLSEIILDKFLQKISNQKVDNLKEEAVLVYLVLYQSQTTYKSIPDDALAEITAQEWFPKILQDLNNGGCFVYPFLEVLIKCLVKNGIEEDGEHYRMFLMDLLNHLKIDDEYVSSCLNAVIDSLPSKLNKKSEETRNWLAEMVETIEKQYPTPFDKQVYEILVSTNNEKRKSNLQKILKNALTLKKKFDIFDKLYHPNALIRTDAMKFISTNFSHMNDMEKDMLKVSLEQRLKDEDVDVVKEALSIVKNTKVIPNVELKNILMELLSKIYRFKNNWNKILGKVIQMLCIAENSKDFKVILNIFPLLLPKTNDEINIAKSVMESELFLDCVLFQHFDRNADLKNPGDFPNQLFKSLKSVENRNFLLEFLKHINQADYGNFSPLQKYITALIMSNMVIENSPLDEVLPFLEILEKFFRMDETKNMKVKNSILENLKVCKKGKLPVGGFLQCILDIVSKIKSLQLHKIDFSKSDISCKFLLLVTSIIYREDEIHSQYIDLLNSSLFLNIKVKIEFMLHLAVFKKWEDSELQNITLVILKKEIANNAFNPEEFFDLKNNFVPYLLVLLTSPDENIRKRTMEICEEILKSAVQKKNSYSFLLKSLMEQQEDIILDVCQLPIVVSNTLDCKQTKLNVGKAILHALVELSYDSELPLYLVTGILEVLSQLNSIEIFEKTSILACSILEKNSEEYNNFESSIILRNIQRFDDSVGKGLNQGMNIYKFLISLLKNDRQCLSIHNEKKSPSFLLIEHLDAAFIASLSREIEFAVLDLIVEVSTISQNPKMLLASNKIFKHIDLDIKQILPQLNQMKEMQSQREIEGRRKRRVSMVPTIDILDTKEWRKGVRILELIQDKKRISNVGSLLPILFDILKKCLDFDEQSAVEYPKQLILSLLLHSCQKLEGERISENVFNMELVVQCIRASQNPQTHHHALLVLAHCASLIPTQVLHHIMAIFTFMGSSVLRHDDAYSFQLITNIIDTVVPILVSDNDTETIISVLRVFVDVLLDVPEHRRMALYTQLLQKINPEQHLHTFLLLVFVSHVLRSPEEIFRTPKHKFEDIKKTERLDIAGNLTREFPPDVIFTACTKLIEYLRELPVEQDNLEKGKLEIDPSDLTPKQYRHFKYTIVIFINSLISSKEFVNKIALLPDDTLEGLERYYKDIVVNILSYIQKTTPILDKYSNTNQAQYWRAIQHHSLEILDGMNALLTVDMFLLVIKGLMTHNLPNIRKRALDLLNSKLQHSITFIEECQQDQLFALVNPLVAIIDKINIDGDEDEDVVIQTALLSLKLIIKNIGSESPDKFVPVLEFITNIIKSGRAQGNVLASLILCIAELCVALRARAIQSLPNFMPVLLKILKQQKYQDSPTLLCLSLLTVILKILESLSLFISPYLKRLLSEISQFTSKWESSTEDPKLAPFIQKLTNVKQKIGETIAPRVFIPAVEESYEDLIEKHSFDAIVPLMGILSEHLTHMTGTDITSNLPELTKFFMRALEFRNEEKCDIEKTNIIEDQIVEALSKLVLKLSETTFRPLYYKIFDWAIRNEVKSDRVITFYNVSSGLARHLKSLFVLFAGHFINNAAQILDACNKTKTETLYFKDQNKSVLLLEKVLETLTFVFKYTTMKFINKERFEILMQPIVDHLENDLDGIDKSMVRNNVLLTPCIVQFAVATADDALWKQMNYQVLLKMRSVNPKIRLISLKCLTEIVKQLGEDFLPLLPETIPFLSELLEDEDESVEKNCQKAIQEMEKVLGESLQKYF